MNKGVILCGGNGTRLRPLTHVMNKHLLPVWDKPMVLYPLETLKALEIKDILLVSGGEHIGRFTEFLGDGREYGVNLTYRVQRDAGGIAEALGLAKDFANGESIVVILGDNIFENAEITRIIPAEDFEDGKACIFLKIVKDPQRFGSPVFELGGDMEPGGVWHPESRLIRIEEKPKEPQNNYAVTGLYRYPNSVFDIIPTLEKSGRGELEITDVNNWFIEKQMMEYKKLDGFWSDAGTFESLLSSSNWAKENPQ